MPKNWQRPPPIFKDGLKNIPSLKYCSSPSLSTLNRAIAITRSLPTPQPTRTTHDKWLFASFSMLCFYLCGKCKLYNRMRCIHNASRGLFVPWFMIYTINFDAFYILLNASVFTHALKTSCLVTPRCRYYRHYNIIYCCRKLYRILYKLKMCLLLTEYYSGVGVIARRF